MWPMTGAKLGANVLALAPMTRRGHNEDAIYFDHAGDCRDDRFHRGCPGRWRGAVSLGAGRGGRRIRRKVTGPTNEDVKGKLKTLNEELDVGAHALSELTNQSRLDT